MAALARVTSRVVRASAPRSLAAQAPRTLSTLTAAELESVVDQRSKAAKRELAILAEAFNRYDGDRNGTMDREEMAKALNELELPDSEFEVDRLFQHLDENMDGSIQLTEWLDRLPRGTRVRICSKFEDGSISFANACMPELRGGRYQHVKFEFPVGKIIYTHTDEAPALATYSFLPIIEAFVNSSDVTVEKRDISVAGRIIAAFPDFLDTKQVQEDELAKLGELAKTPEANIIKLPNVSASIPQLCDAIAELQSKGYNVPSYPAEPANDEEVKIQQRYGAVLGSAVNPVLREGNSDRRVARPVKEFAMKNPKKLGAWSSDSASHVSHMSDNDFFATEQSHIMDAAGAVRIEHVSSDGTTTVLKAKTPLLAGEVIDSSCMRVAELRSFFAEQISDAKAKGVLFSLHLKATMMKVSDPIMFGHCVEVFFADVFAKHQATFDELGVNTRNGFQDVLDKIATLPEAQRAEIEADIEAAFANGPDVAMVDSAKGITNLHVPNDVIIDASMPPVIRDSGKMWNKDDALQDCKMVIPDRSYATMYDEIVNYCRENGGFDAATMGNVANVGLMAQKAEEYGSHDKTFEAPSEGTIRVVDVQSNAEIFNHSVSTGDVWRMAQTKDSPIQDWVKLAVNRAKATGVPAIFWLNENRAHDSKIIQKVNTYLKDMDTDGLDIRIRAPQQAMKETLDRVAVGEDTISVTGNVLRDYLTDLFPILELGTSAKMLSIVPLLAGGGLFETGAGGSAPKHVQQMEKEGHLRWDSLGEFLALAVSIEDLGNKTGNEKAKVLAESLNSAIGDLLVQGKNPGRKVGQLDNRGSHFYVAKFWAEQLAAQTKDSDLAAEFAPIAANLNANEETILTELSAASGAPVDLGGWFMPDERKAELAMRPSKTLNGIIDNIVQDAEEELVA